MLTSVLLFAAALLTNPDPGSQKNVEPLGEPTTEDSESERSNTGPLKRADSPSAAYRQGDYASALQGFADMQVDNPLDARIMMNIGNSHYQMKNYPEADKAFQQAALNGGPELRSRAFYNLGNSAFHQGRLEEAVKLYQAALELNPEDADAKYNIEFVRNEIRRRIEEAKKRQEQQQQQGEQQEQQQEQQQNGQSGENGEQQDNNEQSDRQRESERQSSDRSNESANSKDTDDDGLPDQLETTGKNRTDPNNPDTDGDGLKDGEEDKNRNGQVDKGETDPTKPDAENATGTGAAKPTQEDKRELTPEEAAGYLRALEDKRPQGKRTVKGRRRQPLKDW